RCGRSGKGPLRCAVQRVAVADRKDLLCRDAVEVPGWRTAARRSEWSYERVFFHSDGPTDLTIDRRDAFEFPGICDAMGTPLEHEVYPRHPQRESTGRVASEVAGLACFRPA